MVKRNILRWLFLVLLVFTLVSCTKGRVSDAWEVILVQEDIDKPTVWNSGRVYLIYKWDFSVNSTLTIQAGTVVKFHPVNGPDLTLNGSGSIIAEGTSGSPIVFTSFYDDAYGGDTNDDDDASLPARLDWGYINTNGLSGSIFEYCLFLYGGNSNFTNTLSVEEGSAATVKNCLFAHNDGSDASGWFGALDASSAGAGTIIQDNVFYDNIRPLSISDYFNIDNSNTFHNPENNAETNEFNGIFVFTDQISSALSWVETEVPFVIDDSDWWITGNGTLTLANNVILKFREGSEIVLQAGASALVNYGGTGVYFTSYRDDARGGDTNGDGNATVPGNGDWGGIYNDLTDSYMSWGNILYDNH